MPLDLTKPVQTHDGRKARIICTDVKGASNEQSILALVEQWGTAEAVFWYRKDGTTKYSGSNSFLTNVPEKIERWINVYRHRRTGIIGTGQTAYPSEEIAAAARANSPLPPFQWEYIGPAKFSLIVNSQ